MIQLNSLEKKQRVEEKRKRDLEQSELQRRMFEEAVKNVGADVSALGNPKPIELEKEGDQDKRVETQPKATKKRKTQKNKTVPVLDENKSLRTELMFPTGEVVEEEVSTKPSVQDSLNKIKERKEMKKKESLESLKSKKMVKGVQSKESRRSSQQSETRVEKKQVLPEKAITSQVAQPEKKGKVKLRGKKKKAANEEEKEEECESIKDSVDSFDYNQVMPIEVVAGTVNYYAPLLPKKEKITDVSNGKVTTNKCASQEKQAVKTGISTERKGKKSKQKEEYLGRNSHRFIKGDYPLMAFAQDYLHIKDCEEAESKFRRLNP